MTEEEKWERLKTLFARSLEHAEAEREAWLARECPDDPALRAEVLQMLEDRRKGEAMFGGGAAEMLGNLMPEEDVADVELGSTVGMYRLTQLLGKGGMGRVYLAERADGQFAHQVALKLIRSDFATPELQLRFLRERNTLARLKHPNIAQLHDGGMSEAGAPYFTLEFIDGKPITRWCDEHHSDLRTRVRLLLKVCDAVQHAHRNLIVHRDLKPSNILVTDGGEPKLLDFGIAKPLTENLDDAELTHAAAQPMTREYAAPEQVLGEPATTATDIYSLGVLLYLLACGRMPYRRAATGQIGWIKAILEDAPEPLDRAVDRTLPSTNSNADVVAPPLKNTAAPETIAAARSISLPSLKRALRGDLERIVQRALAKSPEARYPTVVALSDDLSAWLAGRALSGGTRTYRLRKFVRRHWLPLAAAAALLIAIVGGVAIMVADARKIEREAQTTAAVKDFLVGLFRSADPQQSNGKDITALELVKRGASHITEIKDQPRLRGELESVLGEIDDDLAQFTDGQHLEESAVADLQAGDAAPLTVARSELEQAHALIEGVGDYAAADRVAQVAIDRLRHLEPSSAQELARGLSLRAYAALAMHKFDAAVDPANESLDWARRPNVAKSVLAETLDVAAEVAGAKRDYARSESLLREALAVRRSIGGDNDPAVVVGLQELARTVGNRGRIAEALDLLRQADDIAEKVLGANDPRLANVRSRYGDELRLVGRFQQAEDLLDKAESYYATLTDDGGAATMVLHEERAQLRVSEGKLEEADALYGRVVQMSEKLFGKGSSFEKRIHLERSLVHALQGNLDDAGREIADLEKTELETTGKNSLRMLLVAGNVDELRGAYEESERHLRQGLDMERKVHGDKTFETAGFLNLLGVTLHKMHRDDEAEADLRETVAIFKNVFVDIVSPSLAKADLLLSELLASHPEKRDEAIALAQTAATACVGFYGEDDKRTREAKEQLGRLKELH